MTQSNYKIALFLAIFSSLLFYHILKVLKIEFLPAISNNYDLIALVNLVQFSTAIGLSFLVIYNKFVIRLILRNNFIEGEYFGASKNTAGQPNSGEIENFIITQNLFETVIRGTTIIQSNKDNDVESHYYPKAKWHGNVFKIEAKNKYYFGIELEKDTNEYGIFVVEINGEEATGFYYPGKPTTSNVFHFAAKRKKQALIKDLFRW